MTKWEKFRIEKGIPTKAKRSRMVFDPITQDWVPRYGAGSIKKIEDKHNWMMEVKPKHDEAGVDPFTYQRSEKKIEKEKQALRELKNQVSTSGPAGKGGAKVGSTDQILDPAGPASKQIAEAPPSADPKSSFKNRDEQERNTIRKRERKSLMKSL